MKRSLADITVVEPGGHEDLRLLLEYLGLLHLERMAKFLGISKQQAHRLRAGKSPVTPLQWRLLLLCCLYRSDTSRLPNWLAIEKDVIVLLKKVGLLGS